MMLRVDDTGNDFKTNQICDKNEVHILSYLPIQDKN